ncbi:unnamed protein product, partial [Mesorhabditis spiculigera]
MNSVFVFGLLIGAVFAWPAWHGPEVAAAEGGSCEGYHLVAEEAKDPKVRQVAKILAGIVCDADGDTIKKYNDLGNCVAELDPEDPRLLKGCAAVVDDDESVCENTAQAIHCQMENTLSVCGRPDDMAFLARFMQIGWLVVEHPEEIAECAPAIEAMFEKAAAQ